MRVALGIEYDGGAYRGWQRQGHDPLTVQETLENALSVVADHPVTVICAGRTDTGVHGLGQVVHFDSDAPRIMDAWMLGANTRLPPDISVRWAQPVDETFHARYKAFARRYCYVIANTRSRPALAARKVTWQYRPLDADLMHRAARSLIGQQDFSSFRAADCQSRTPVKTVTDAVVERQGDLVLFSIRADAFLHHMVRNIVGVLMKIGAGKQPAEWINDVIEARDRRAAAPTAHPDGLYLMGVEYPPEFGIPVSASRYPFIAGVTS